MGNPVQIGGKTLTWGEGRMLLGISQDENNHIEYTYNADGLRTYQVVTEDGVSTATRYVWGNKGLAAVISNGQMVAPLYDDNGEAVGFMVATVNEDPRLAPTEEIYTYVKNLQGDVIRILDGDGNAVVSYTYDPWGVPTVHGDADLAAINPCSYRGYYYDEETGYYYLQSRYYDPQIGRLLNADVYVSTGRSILGSNVFAYCINNPLNYIDPTGHYGIYLSDYLILALSGALSSLVVSIQAAMISIKAAIASSIIPVVCIAAVAVGIAAITYAIYKVRSLQVSAQKVITAVQTQVLAKKLKQSSLKGYTVYTIARKGTADVVYVGITKNYSSRQYTHQRKPKAKYPEAKYDMVPIATDLSYKQARALEQTVICAYGITTLNNMINSISPSKWAYFKQEFEQMASLIESFFDPE